MIVRKADADRLQTVVASLSRFHETEPSVFDFDIRKEMLRCDPLSSLARKAALTAIMICELILRGSRRC